MPLEFGDRLLGDGMCLGDQPEVGEGVDVFQEMLGERQTRRLEKSAGFGELLHSGGQPSALGGDPGAGGGHDRRQGRPDLGSDVRSPSDEGESGVRVTGLHLQNRIIVRRLALHLQRRTPIAEQLRIQLAGPGQSAQVLVEDGLLERQLRGADAREFGRRIEIALRRDQPAQLGIDRCPGDQQLAQPVFEFVMTSYSHGLVQQCLARFVAQPGPLGPGLGTEGDDQNLRETGGPGLIGQIGCQRAVGGRVGDHVVVDRQRPAAQAVQIGVPRTGPGGSQHCPVVHGAFQVVPLPHGNPTRVGNRLLLERYQRWQTG